jgi:hypothetical protein
MRRNCLLKHVIKGKIQGRIDVTGRRERRRKKLLDYLKEKRGYCKLKEKNYIALHGEFALGEAMGLSQDRQQDKLEFLSGNYGNYFRVLFSM